MHPGEYILANNDIECNVGRVTACLTAVNTGDRPVQEGSHFHFFELNKQLSITRETAFGMRLDIAAGTAVRFEPGEEKNIHLVGFGGNQHIQGFNNLVNGHVNNEAIKEVAIQKLSQNKFKTS